jgi:hypothetical protein
MMGYGNIGLLNKISMAVYSLICGIIFCISWSTYIRLKNAKTHDLEKWTLFMACLVYSLVCIRFKDYSYILLIPATYHIIGRVKRNQIQLILFVLISLSAVHVTLPGVNVAFHLIWNYYPLMIAYGVWVLFLGGGYLKNGKDSDIEINEGIKL